MIKNILCITLKNVALYFELLLNSYCAASCIDSTAFIPGISLASKDSLHESLRWHPFDRQHGTTAFPVIAGSGKRE